MILWVDDDTLSTLDSFIEDISDEGWDIILAQDPDEMWDILKEPEKPINGIIMDIMMPTGKSIDPGESKMGIMSGLVLLDMLKMDEKYKNIPILIFTIVDELEVNQFADEHNIPLLIKQNIYQEDLIEELVKLNIPKDRP